MSAFLGVPVDAAYHLVSLLTGTLSALALPGGVAATGAIIVLMAAIWLLLMPLSYRAMRGLEAQARIAPRVQALRKLYAGRPDKLQAELTALYKAEGTSMFAGFLPLLVQWPFSSVMYLLFRSSTIDGAPNSLLANNLLGAPLGSHWLVGAGLISTHGAVFAGLFVLLAIIAWLSSRLTRRLAAAAADGAGAAQPARPLGAVTRLAPYLTV